MNYFKKILLFAKPYRKYAVLNIIFNIFYALFSTLGFLALIPMLDVLFKQEKPPVKIAPTWEGITGIKDFIFDYLNFYVTQIRVDYGESSTLFFVCGLIVSLFLLKNISNYFAMFFITFLRNGVLRDLRDTTAKKIIQLPVSFFSEKRKGDVMARITTDIQEIQWTFLAVLELAVREPLNIIFTLISMIMLSAKLTLFVFIFLPISGIIISMIGKKLKKHSDRAQKEQGHFLSLIEETLTGLRVIKGYNAEKKMSNKIFTSTSKLNKILNSLLNRQNIASPLSETLGIASVAVILWFGGHMVLVENTMDGATFIGFITLTYNILAPAKQISKASYNIKKGNAAAERILEILETENTIVDPEQPKELKSFESEITFENISFKYDQDYVLEDFSLTIPKGKTVALVGQSGSGKSTLANLITRFYDVNKGSVKIDGKDIREVTQHDLRSLMGIVNQKAILFNDTIKNNIMLGVENATDEEVENAAKIANAHEFIMNRPNGYDDNIGDSGDQLSGGQQQRISIARAVLKNPPIMILDEATSALDTEAEKAVQDALENMMKNRTSIVIAHRLSTIKNADLIVVMRNGKIVEKGTHQELIAHQGEYHKLVNMQSFD
ncbi:ABC transporter ATP-binding protein [Aureivirga sp. CE67]|uniref:ABC transporter ATP-binding protein n=1 Tax=Aureivirga sp. CE67 TaxID=1788983 RepID=UPI0018C94C31|nr:ABC transporter ATP-binding protein [Aureivirga sp. CE67]